MGSRLVISKNCSVAFNIATLSLSHISSHVLPFFFLNFSYNFKILLKRKYLTIDHTITLTIKPTITLMMSTIKPKSICMSIILIMSTITPKPNPNTLYSFNTNPFCIPSFCSSKGKIIEYSGSTINVYFPLLRELWVSS